MRSRAHVGTSPLARVCLSVVGDGDRETVFRLDVQHTVPAARDVASDLFDEAEAFGEAPGGPHRLHLALSFADGTGVDTGTSRATWARGGSQGRQPLLVGGEGGAHETDASPTRTADRLFRLQPRPAAPLTGVELRWLALGIPTTRTEW